MHALPQPEKGFVRVAHWNILTHPNNDVEPQQTRESRFADVINAVGSHICCLLEVTSDELNPEKWRNMTGMDYHSVPYENGHELALLVRPDIPITFTEIAIPSRKPSEKHSAFIAKAKIHEKTIGVASVHLAWRVRHELLRTRQLATIAKKCMDFSRVVLTADTNALPWWPSRQIASRKYALSSLMHHYGNPGTFPSIQIHREAYDNLLQKEAVRFFGSKGSTGIWQVPIDEIYYRNVIPVNAYRITGPSDHDGIVADFKL